MFFSATLDGVVGRLANAYTRDPKIHEVVSQMQTVDEVDHIFVKVDQNDKLSTLINVLQEAPGMALVFVRTKRGADRLSRKLKSHGMKADAIHGDLTQSQRERSLRRFEKGQVATLVATDVAARGIDVDGIARVINFDPPDDHKSYVHRVGRTARAGRTGTGITLVIPSQEGDVGRVASRLKLEGQFEKDGMKVPLPAMAFSSSRRGRRPGGARGGQRRRRR
jgi:superfamily II DNA/RNA helicase